jgi:hypothetical protein
VVRHPRRRAGSSDAAPGTTSPPGDNGLAHTTEGERIGNAAHGKAYVGQLAEVHQSFRTQQGSKRHSKTR